MSMGPDIFLTHLARTINAGMLEPYTPEDLALHVYSLGTVSPIVDSFSGDVLGFRFEMVARKHATAHSPNETAVIEVVNP